MGGFNASKIVSTDSSVSTKEEAAAKLLSEELSDKDSLDEIERAIENATNEANRLQARLDKINAVKKIYDAKELESRKEICTQCKGEGATICARCKGSGEIVVKDRGPCPTCSKDTTYPRDDFDYTVRESTVRKGQIRKMVSCNYCRSTGQITPTCGVCKGKGRLMVSHGGARLSSIERCDSCNGRGREYPQNCPKCSGDRKIEVWQTCPTCQGRVTVVNGSKTTCPVCEGKAKLECEHCKGRGFVYRAKD